MKKYLFTTAVLVLSFVMGFAQLTLPPGGGNQKSVTTQYIGSLVHVTITYNSPDVTSPQGEDRTGKIWGQLIPYGLTDLGFGLREPAPWRAGANENTTIKFSHDVVLQGKSVKAGKYGFHVGVAESGPWTIYLTNTNSAWGSYFFQEEDVVLEVTAEPSDHEFHEWLTYEFIDRQPTSATVALMWENKKLPFTIEVPDMNELYVTKLEEDLVSSLGFNWQNLNAAANFCLQNDIHLDKGMAWAKAAVGQPFIGQENFQTLQTLGGLQAKTGKMEEALATMDKAVKHPAATPFQIHAYGRQLIAQGKKEKAMEIFKYNFDRFDGAWPTEVGMARGLSATGHYAEALEHAKKAHEQAPDQLNKNGMANAIEKLKNKQDIN